MRNRIMLRTQPVSVFKRDQYKLVLVNNERTKIDMLYSRQMVVAMNTGTSHNALPLLISLRPVVECDELY